MGRLGILYEIKRFHSLFCYVLLICFSQTWSHFSRGCFRQSAVPNSELAVLAAARLKLSGGEMGSGPGSVAVPNGTGLEGGTVK